MDQADTSESTHITKIFVMCNASDPAPGWGYTSRQQEVSVILEAFMEKAIDRGSTELSDKFRNCFT